MTGVYSPDTTEEFFVDIPFKNVGSCTLSKCPRNSHVSAVRRQNYNSCVGVFLADGVEAIETVSSGHLKIHQSDIRSMFSVRFECLFSI